ncbi:CPXCG motif-containing cysteine-rich protein [Polaribacter cellanae]|uniref:CPXCG motif-containing cysteine-rich protein n=1 Tax=Polaribacter cellanae TaxID=2818493 RepID=A0A975CPJ7_9FLAO|nr:CPXCG motif-containing cysteine-rich protein [Polaribacter cellanae]QTE23134.1 CPXCG motif-containing cysteine-rich protein [Polaribacter cellanae]
MEQQHFFQCPYCWEEISMILDASIHSQTYIEDCEVCCNPIEVSPTFKQGKLIDFRFLSIEQ